MEKKTTRKAENWNKELEIKREIKKNREKNQNKAEYIPRKQIETYQNKERNLETYTEIEQKARNNERLLIFFFTGIIICTITWQIIIFIKEKYWVDQIKETSQKIEEEINKKNKIAEIKKNKIIAAKLERQREIEKNEAKYKKKWKRTTWEVYNGKICTPECVYNIKLRWEDCYRPTGKCTTKEKMYERKTSKLNPTRVEYFY